MRCQVANIDVIGKLKLIAMWVGFSNSKMIHRRRDNQMWTCREMVFQALELLQLCWPGGQQCYRECRSAGHVGLCQMPDFRSRLWEMAENCNITIPAEFDNAASLYCSQDTLMKLIKENKENSPSRKGMFTTGIVSINQGIFGSARSQQRSRVVYPRHGKERDISATAAGGRWSSLVCRWHKRCSVVFGCGLFWQKRRTSRLCTYELWHKCKQELATRGYQRE